VAGAAERYHGSVTGTRPAVETTGRVEEALTMGDNGKNGKNEKNGKFEFTATLEPAQAADYLSRIADGLRRGVIGLAAAGRSIRMEPGAWVTVEIAAESKPEKAKGSLAVEVSWKARERASSDTLEVTVDPREEAEHAASGGRSRD
jgi:amphi-Trp domain-containing protein